MINVPPSVWKEEDSEQYKVSYLEDMLVEPGYNDNRHSINKIYVEQLLKNIEPQEKEIIVLKYIHCLTDEDISRKLNIKKDKINWILRIAMQKINKEF